LFSSSSFVFGVLTRTKLIHSLKGIFSCVCRQLLVFWD
jgi:hypothetical protein